MKQIFFDKIIMYSYCPQSGKIAYNVIKHNVWYIAIRRYTNPHRERNYLIAVARGLCLGHFQPPSHLKKNQVIVKHTCMLKILKVCFTKNIYTNVS